MRTTRLYWIAIAFLAGIALLAVLSAQNQRSAQSEGPGPMDSVLLKDYKPDSSLVVPVTNVPKPRFAAIDVHSHTYASTPEAVANWVRTMDEVGVEMTVVLTMATGDSERRQLYSHYRR